MSLRRILFLFIQLTDTHMQMKKSRVPPLSDSSTRRQRRE